MEQTIQELNEKLIKLQLEKAENGEALFDREEELEKQLTEKDRKIEELEEKLKGLK